MDKVLLGTANKQKNPENSVQERSDIAQCEKEQICLLATQIKLQKGTIRHFKPILDEGFREIENKVSLEPQPKRQGVPCRKFPSKKTEQEQTAKPKRKIVRQREAILFKKKWSATVKGRGEKTGQENS